MGKKNKNTDEKAAAKVAKRARQLLEACFSYEALPERADPDMSPETNALCALQWAPGRAIQALAEACVPTDFAVVAGIAKKSELAHFAPRPHYSATEKGQAYIFGEATYLDGLRRRIPLERGFLNSPEKARDKAKGFLNEHACAIASGPFVALVCTAALAQDETPPVLWPEL